MLNASVLAFAGLLTASAVAESGTWQPLAGPRGGVVSDLAAGDGHVIAGLGTASIFRRASDADTWSAGAAVTTDGWRVRDLATARGVTLASDDLGRVWRSADGGTTWTEVTTPGSGGIVTVLATDAMHLVIRAPGGVAPLELHRSFDDGVTWQPATAPVLDSAGFATYHVDGAALYVASGTSVQRTLDHATSWQEITDGLPVDFWSIAGTDGAAIALRSGFGQTTWYSDDAGATWQTALDGISGGVFTAIETVTADGVMLTLQVTSNAFDVQRSFDGGATWASAAPRGLEPGTTALRALVADGATVLAGFTTGIWRSDDFGATWTRADDGIAAQFVPVLRTVGATTPRVIAARANGASSSSTDGGATWQDDAAQPAMINTLVDLGGDVVLAGLEDNGIRRSFDGGATWQATSGVPIYGSTSGPRVQPVNAIARTADGVLFGATGGGPHFVTGDVHCGCSSVPSGIGVVRSTNGGATWHVVNSGLPINEFDLGVAIYHPIESLVAVGGVAIAGTTAHGVYRTTNGGASWIATAGPGGAVALAVRGADVFALDEAGALWRSETNGATWTLVSTTLPIAGAQGLAATDDTLLLFGGAVSAGTGVQRSLDGGVTWRAVGTGLDGVVVLDVDLAGATWRAGTAERSGFEFIPDVVPGDVNGDGVVGLDDVLAVLAAWGACAGCAADVDASGFVDFADLVIVLGAWT